MTIGERQQSRELILSNISCLRINRYALRQRAPCYILQQVTSETFRLGGYGPQRKYTRAATFACDGPFTLPVCFDIPSLSGI